MYLLPTRHRPAACGALIAAMQETGDVPPVAVLIDQPGIDPPCRAALAAYAEVPWPKHWTVTVAQAHLELTRAVNLLVAMNPGQAFYGLIGDHCRPRTPGWSGRLAAAAGDWNIAYCRDNWCNGRRLDDPARAHVSGAIVLGGKLVRALGWFLLPGTVHLWGDDALELIGERLELMRYLDDVVLETHRAQAGRAPQDANHRRVYRGSFYPPRDRAVFERWRATEADRVVARVAAARTPAAA